MNKIASPCKSSEYLKADFLANLNIYSAAINDVIYNICSSSAGCAGTNSHLPMSATIIPSRDIIYKELSKSTLSDYFISRLNCASSKDIIEEIDKEAYPKDFDNVNLIDLGRGIAIAGLRAIIRLQSINASFNMDFSPTEINAISIKDVQSCIIIYKSILSSLDEDFKYVERIVWQTSGGGGHKANGYYGNCNWPELHGRFMRNANISRASLVDLFHQLVCFHVWKFVELIHIWMNHIDRGSRNSLGTYNKNNFNIGTKRVISDDAKDIQSVKKDLEVLQDRLFSRISSQGIIYYKIHNIKSYLLLHLPVVLTNIVMGYSPYLPDLEMYLKNILGSNPFPYSWWL